MTATRGASTRNRLAVAIRDMIDGKMDSRATTGMIGIVSQTGTATTDLKVSVPDYGFELDADTLLVGQAVAQFDQDYGLKVGDSLALMPTAAGDFIAIAVLTSTIATLRGEASFAYVDSHDATTLASAHSYADAGDAAIAAAVPVVPVGAIIDFAGAGTPAGPATWVPCDGSSLARATYPTLFSTLVQSLGTFTVTLASPGVFTTGAPHGLRIGDPVYFTTTGALPTGLTADTQYYVMTVPLSTTFTVGTVRTINANGIPTVTTAVNTSVSQSGTHTAFFAPHGFADATHFNAPDMRGRAAVGAGPGAGLTAKSVGALGGEETHLLTANESGTTPHNHPGGAQTGTESALHSHAMNTTAWVDGTVQTANWTADGDVTGTSRNFKLDGSLTMGTESAAHTHTDPAPGAATASPAGSAHNTLPPMVVVAKWIRAA